MSITIATAPAAAAPKRITGELSRPGYTVIALAADGKARTVRVARRKFAVQPPAPSVTLHLRGANGVYAGPIVIRAEGRRAILGVKAGAKLGRIKVGPTYSRLVKQLQKRSVDATRFGRARKGVPIGAGVFGRVLTSRGGASVPGDTDVDGIPDRLDVDDDGDLVLDNIDPSPTVRKAQLGSPFSFSSILLLEVEDTANANAAALSTQDIDAALSREGVLMIGMVPGDPGTPVELDCGGSANPTPPPAWVGGLPYCTSGGTGEWAFSGPPGPRPPFPACCDPDGDGFGALTPFAGGGNPRFFLHHGATTAQIRTGDVLVERVTTGGVETHFPATLQAVFATVPALVSYSDSAGNSATVSYPVARFTPGNPPPFGAGFVPGGPGTRGNGFPVAPGPSGDIVLTLTFWRPQRTPIPPETAQWIDIGGLTYSARPMRDLKTGAVLEANCPPDAYATSDPSLRVELGAIKDTASDRPASAANTFTYSVNVTRCLAAKGLSFDPGQEIDFDLLASSSGGDSGVQSVSFRRP